MLTKHDCAPGGDEPALDELRADARAGRVEVVADRHAQRHHAPVERQPARGLVAFGRRDDRRARAQRRQAPRRAAAARDRDDGLRVAAIGQRDRRLAERLGVIVVRPDRRPRAQTSDAGLASASRMIASSVCTARAGYAPAAVSPASMIASTPSSTAFAASLTSARVGRASVVIDSSTCVATMTGTPAGGARAR